MRLSEWTKTTRSIKRIKYRAKKLKGKGEFAKIPLEENFDYHVDSKDSGRMICNHVVRMCSKRYVFDDEALKTMAFLELMFGRTIL